MTLNTFEGGVPAATITVGNSGGASGDAFNAVAIVAGGTATYITPGFRGARAGRFASGATAGVVQAEYTSSIDVAGAGKVYGRCRFRLPVLPGDATGVRVMVLADGTGSFRASLHINNAGKLSIRGPAGTALVTSTFTYTANTWCDVGFAVLVVSATVGQIEAKIYSAGVEIETMTSTANQNTLGAGGVFRLQNGMVRSLANTTVDLDDLAFDLNEYPDVPVIDAAGAPALPAVDGAAAGAVAADAESTLILPPAGAAGAGTVALDGAGGPVLPALTVDGAADLLEPIVGGGAMQLPALQSEGAGEILPGCEQWPYDTSCLPEGWPATPAGMDAGQLSAYEFAQEMLDGLTLGKYGLCSLTVRPCGVGCAVRAGLRLTDGGWFWPQLRGGQVFNGCGCQIRCGCTVASEVLLDGPVYDVLRVRVDGQLIDPTTYRVDGGVRLVRVDGQTWPMVQDLNASDGLAGTFDVTYRRGSPVPRGGRRALAALMVELQKAACGDTSCRLPSRVTNIVREGVTYSMLDDPSTLLQAGRTGVPEVDLWLALVNPTQTRSRMRVYSPDLATVRRQTWPRP